MGPTKSYHLDFWNVRFWRRAGEIWCLSWGKGVNRVSDVTGMIDSNMTKMDFPFSALDAGVIPHHFRHVYDPLEVCEQPGR